MATDITRASDPQSEQCKAADGKRRFTRELHAHCQHRPAGVIATTTTGRKLAFCQHCNTLGSVNSRGEFIVL